jgi:hypothetical protein
LIVDGAFITIAYDMGCDFLDRGLENDGNTGVQAGVEERDKNPVSCNLHPTSSGHHITGAEHSVGTYHELSHVIITLFAF